MSGEFCISVQGQVLGLDEKNNLLLHGISLLNEYKKAATSASPKITTVAGNIITLQTQAKVTGDSRAIYARQFFSLAGSSGEAIRAYGTVDTAGTASGGTVNGSHITLSVTGAGTIVGAGNALRATLDLGAATTSGGTLAVIQADSNIATDANIPARTAFVRCTDSGVGKLSYLLNMPTVASAGILAAHTTDGITHSIRCIDAAGTVFYIMCTTTDTHRTGGA